MKDKASQSIIASLDQQLRSVKTELEEAGLQIEGHSGGSQEGPVWMFQFRKVWSIPPDEASAIVHVWWSDWPNGSEVRVVRLADIYRQGQVSSFKDKAESVLSVSAAISSGVRSIVEAAIEEARLILEITSNKAFNPTSLPPLHYGKAGG